MAKRRDDYFVKGQGTHAARVRYTSGPQIDPTYGTGVNNSPTTEDRDTQSWPSRRGGRAKGRTVGDGRSD